MTEERGRVHADHAELVARVEGAHADLRELLDQLSHARDLSALAEGLRGLPQLLAEHFAEEEAPGGLYDGLRHRRPAVEDHLKRLCREHELLQEQVCVLAERVGASRSGDDPADELAQLREQASTFVDLLRSHERLETRLVSEIYYSEDGVSG